MTLNTLLNFIQIIDKLDFDIVKEYRSTFLNKCLFKYISKKYNPQICFKMFMNTLMR